MSRTVKDISLQEILPYSIAEDEKVIAVANAAGAQLQELGECVEYPAIMAYIDYLTTDQLDHVARQYDATWRDSWFLSKKRSVLKTTIANKRLVGTVAAVKAAVEAISSTASIEEWWQQEPMGDPHTFIINVAGGSTDIEDQEDLIKQIESAKPVRSWYTLYSKAALTGGIGITGILRSIAYARISHLS